MVEKNIGRFGVGSFADITHVVSVPAQSSSANIDPVLIPKEDLKGDAGTDGLSAYEIAVVEGFEGTEAEWLDSLKGSPGVDGSDGTNGTDGKSAYEIAVENGFVGNESAWLVSLKGADGTDGTDGTNGTDGADGKSAYELAVDGGFVGDQTAWLASLKGADGTDGAKGDDGDSAYQVAVTNGFVGDETAWLASLKGADGADGTDGTDGANAPELQIQGSPDDATWGTVDSTSAYLRFSVDDGNTWSSSTKIRGENGTDGTDGSNGADGKSAYQVAVDEGFVGDEAAWLASLKGADGADGSAGADAPEAIIQGSPDDSTWGVVDNTTVYIRVSTDGGATYSSSTRVRGLDGADGTDGTDGADGVVPLTTILTVSGTTHTFAIANAEKYHRFTSASAKTITVPTNASAAFPFTAEGETTTLIGINAGDGALTIAADSGVTINHKADLSLNIPKWGGFVLTKVGTDEWDLVGDMDPA